MQGVAAKNDASYGALFLSAFLLFVLEPMGTVRSCESRDPGEFSVAFGHARTVTNGLADIATLLKQCERRRVIAIITRRRRKERKRLGLAIPVPLGAAQRKTLLA